ncbi:MAG: hypothetical protein WEB30_01000 [Cyclobacteriaceae bacterium]
MKFSKKNTGSSLSNAIEKPGRRKAIRALGLAGMATVSASGVTGATLPARKAVHSTFNTVDELRQDSSLKVGGLARTMGYYKPGDGGSAEYLVRSGKPDISEGAIIRKDDLYASLINTASVSYKMFGAIGDGQNDDGVQIKMAHAYANAMDIPLINYSGEFWIKGTHSIEIQSNVHWGQTIFHVDEKFGSSQGNLFMVLSREKSVPIEFDPATKAKFLAQIKPGVKLIPELSQFKNSLVIISDTNDKIGYRSGEAYGGRSSKPKEELFFVEEHGRILGDIAWEFTDYTSLVAHPGNDSYLVIDGGSFHMSGENPSTPPERLYIQIGFSVRRSRTIIRNQWVGLEGGKADVSMVPKGGFYSFSNVYDVLLENVRLIPWEKNRPGTDRDVPEGTYGIGGNRVLNATFRNVTAEGSPVHWGVFGTNLFKNFRVEQCVLNRVDVHFHCWNLYIKDSKIGSNGITVTGGGDLFVENTTCMAASFIAFRRDFGAKWDGDIRIRNCRHAPITQGETAILSFVADDFDYKYPIGYGRTVKVEDVVVDFRTVPESESVSWLMRTSAFSQRTDGERVFFPHHLEFRNIMVEGRQQGMRLLKLPDPQMLKLSKTGGYDGVQLKPNCKMIFEDIHLEKIAAQQPQSEDVHFLMKNAANNKYKDEYALYPELRITRCNDLTAYFGGNIAEVILDQCRIVRLTGDSKDSMPGALTFNSCKFEAEVTNSAFQFFTLGTTLGTSFINCVVYAPKVDNTARPDLTDLLGFIRINKEVHFNHINTRLGSDILNYYKGKGVKLSRSFIAMIKSHHELESAAAS